MYYFCVCLSAHHFLEFGTVAEDVEVENVVVIGREARGTMLLHGLEVSISDPYHLIFFLSTVYGSSPEYSPPSQLCTCEVRTQVVWRSISAGDRDYEVPP